MAKQGFSPKSFQDVDRAEDPRSHIRYLDAVTAEEWFSANKGKSIERMALREGDAGLDVGCGTGDDVIAIARVVGPTGYAAGVDMSDVMVQETLTRAAANGVKADVRCTDGATLPFDDGRFDAVRIERVLIHAELPDAVIREMIRVTRPGGRIVALESDFGSSMVDTPHRAIRRKLVAWIEEHALRNGWMGRQMWRRFREAGLLDVVSEPLTRTLVGEPQEYFKTQLRGWIDGAVTADALTNNEAQTYRDWAEESWASGAYFQTTTMFLATGTVPG